MTTLTFSEKIQEINSWKIIRIPQEISSQLPSRGMVMVKGHINAYRFIAPLEPDGQGSHWLALDSITYDEEPASEKDFSIYTETQDGLLTLSIEPMDQWIEPLIPEDLLEALVENQLISEWEACTTKAHWDWIRWIRSTKNPATRTKRIQVTCSKLSKQDKRPCCFNRNICTITEVSKTGILLKE